MVCLILVGIVESTPLVCGTTEVEKCLQPFREQLEKGVAALASLDDGELAEFCW